MDPETRQLKIEINQLRRRMILLEDAVAKLQRATDPPELRRIRAAMKEGGK